MKKLFNISFITSLLFIGIDNIYALDRTCVKCGDGMEIPSLLPGFVSKLILLAQIAVPIILIVTGMIRYVKAVMSGDDKVIKETNSSFIKSIIAAVVVFITVAIVKTAFNVFDQADTSGDGGTNSCVACFITGDCGDEFSCTGRDGSTTSTDVTLKKGCYYDTVNKKYVYKSEAFTVTSSNKNKYSYIAGKDSSDACKETKCTTYTKRSTCEQYSSECVWTSESTNPNGGVCSKK